MLPADYRAARKKVTDRLFPYADSTGRNLMPILDGVLGLLEETAAEGQSVDEVLGADIEGFCAALAGGEGARGFLSAEVAALPGSERTAEPSTHRTDAGHRRVGGRLVGQTRSVHRGYEPVRGRVAGEGTPGAVVAVRGRRQPQHVDPSSRIPEPSVPAAPSTRSSTCSW